jgi:acyl-CoA synthetase (AMP-forming)/AMP-acid ligase II
MKLDVENLRGRRNTGRWNRTSIGDVFDRIRWSDPDREVLTSWEGAYENLENAHLTAARADILANRHANAVRTAGLKEGDIVMMVCENSAEALISKIGLAKAGVTVAPVNPSLSIEVLQYLVALCTPKAIIADTEFASLAKALANEHHIPLLHQIRIGEGVCDAPDFTAFTRDASVREPDVEIHGDDIWQLLFTSGSTSKPKGVMQSHHNIMYTALSFVGCGTARLEYEDDLTVCSFLPLIYHVGDAFIYSSLMAGGRFVMGRRVHPRQIAEAISREKVSFLWAGAPHAIETVVSEFEKDSEMLSTQLRTVMFGWAPMNPALRDRAYKALGDQIRFAEIIGQTEVCCAHRFWLERNDELYRRTAPKENYVGQPHALMAAKIVTSSGREIAPDENEVGEAVYRSPALMAGYYRKPEETQKVIRDGWFHGGDAFKWGEGGQRILADRLKDIVKSGGENVSSMRVEAVVTSHPAVQKTAVVGLPHDRWGEAVTAFVILRANAYVTEDELANHARLHLAGFERPKRFVFLATLPETIGGKVQKHILRARYAELYH